MKIKIECWWTDSHSITNRLINQFVTNYNLLNNIEFVYDNSYDFLIIFGRPKNETLLKNSDKIFCFTMEPVWSPNNSINLHEISDYIWVHDKRGYIDDKSYKEGLVYMLYGGHGELNFNQSEFNWTYSNLITKNFEKKYFISDIVRNSYESHYNFKTDLYQTIYEDRVKIAEYLILNDFPIDIYGHYWDNNINNRIKGSIWNKMIGLNEYRFSISCENTIQKNYISEKFWDVILTETIPIYIGCSNFSENIYGLDEFNFTDIVNDKNEIEYRLKNIMKDEESLYKKYLNTIKELKFEYFNSSKYNLFLKIKELIEQ